MSFGETRVLLARFLACLLLLLRQPFLFLLGSLSNGASSVAHICSRRDCDTFSSQARKVAIAMRPACFALVPRRRRCWLGRSRHRCGRCHCSGSSATFAQLMTVVRLIRTCWMEIVRNGVERPQGECDVAEKCNGECKCGLVARVNRE